MRFRAVLALALLARCAVAQAKPPVECVAVASADGALAALVTDSACTIASHRLTASAFPDLRFGAPLCFVTTFTGKLAIDGRIPSGYAIVAYSGVSTNADGAAIAALPAPLLAFTAATVIEVRSEASGAIVGSLLTRDTGWGRLDASSVLPTFASERLVVTHGAGRLFDGAVGEIVFSGDQFGAGGVARGSLCAPRMKRRVAKLFR